MGLIAVPLLYAPAMVVPAVVAKGVTLRLIGLVTGALLLALGLTHRVKVRRDPAIIALAVLITLLGVSTVTAPSPARSFFGTVERMGGWVTFACLFLILVGLRTFLDERGWSWLLRGAVLTGGLSVAVAAIRYLRTGSISGTYGNPSFMAIALLVLAAIGLAVMAEARKEDGMRWVAGANTLVMVPAIILLGERAAIGALLVATVVGLALYLGGKAGKGVFRAVASALVAAPVVLAGLAVLMALWSGQDRELPLDLETSLSFRYRVAGIAFAAVRARFLGGYGLEGFVPAASRFLDTRLYLLGEPPYVDRVHNAFLESAVSGGVLAMVTYVAFWVGALLTLFRAANRGRMRLSTTAILGAAICGYLTYLFLWFEDLTSFTMLLIIVGFLGSRAYDEPFLTVLEPRPATGLRPVMMALLGAVVLVGGYRVGVRPALAATAAQRGSSPELPLATRVHSYEQAFAYRAPETRRTVVQLVNLLQDIPTDGTPMSRQLGEVVMHGINVGLAELDELIAADPTFDLWYLQRGSLLAYAAQVAGDGRYALLAVEDVQRALDLSPKRIPNYLFLSQLQAGIGEIEAADRTLETAISLRPEYPPGYAYLAEHYALTGRLDQAVGTLRRLYAIDRIPPDWALRTVATRLGEAERDQEVIEILRPYMEQFVDGVRWQESRMDEDAVWISTALREAFLKTGDLDSARAAEQQWPLPD